MADKVEIKIKCENGEFKGDKDVIYDKWMAPTEVIKNLDENDQIELDYSSSNIKLEHVNAIYKFSEYHSDKEIPVVKKVSSDNFFEQADGLDTDFYKTYFEENKGILCELLSTGAFLDYEKYCKLIGANIACYLKDKNADEMRKMFNNPNDWPQGEYEKIKHKNIWKDEGED